MQLLLSLCHSLMFLLNLVQKLFKYIDGNNVDNKKISMTTPVVTFVHPSHDFKSAEKNYTISFYLPQQFQVFLSVSSMVYVHLLGRYVA